MNISTLNVQDTQFWKLTNKCNSCIVVTSPGITTLQMKFPFKWKAYPVLEVKDVLQLSRFCAHDGSG